MNTRKARPGEWYHTECWWQAYHNVKVPCHLVTLRRFKRPKPKFPSPFGSCGKGPPAKEPTLSYRLGKGLLLSRGVSSLPACRTILTRTLLLVPVGTGSHTILSLRLLPTAPGWLFPSQAWPFMACGVLLPKAVSICD